MKHSTIRVHHTECLTQRRNVMRKLNRTGRAFWLRANGAGVHYWTDEDGKRHQRTYNTVVIEYEGGMTSTSRRVDSRKCRGHVPDPERDPQGLTAYCDGSCAI